jgi:endo-1,4-beta-xylanase
VLTLSDSATSAQTQTLRQTADAQKFKIGAAVDFAALNRDAAYKALLAREVNLITAENIMKPYALQPKEGTFAFKDADALIAFARQNKMTVRGHTLVWHQQLPDWMNDKRCAEAEQILKKHVQGVVRHFRGKLAYWDVVNEGFDDYADLRQSLWLKCIGPDYIEKAFRWARAADPKVKLFYNDYGIEYSGKKAEAVFKLVKDLKDKGVPIDGVGLQGHLDGVINKAFLSDYMKRFAEIGIEVQITEFDFRVRVPAAATAYERQAKAYTDLLGVCLDAPNCTGVTLWGITDKYSWVPDFFDGYGDALPFDKNLKPKPAYSAMLTTLAQSKR